MKTRITFFATTILAALAVLSCTAGFEKANTNPNSIAYGDGLMRADNLFEPVFYGIGKSLQSNIRGLSNEIAGVTAHVSGMSGQVHTYFITDGNFQGVWDSYMRYAFDSSLLIEAARNSGDRFLEGAGLILESYCYYILASIWGDVPRSEAFQGRSVENSNRTPVLDSQLDVYSWIIGTLEEAAEIFASAPVPKKPAQDRMYNGDCLKWQKFANSLKMRVLCLLANMDDKYWNAIEEMALNPSKYPVFTSNEDNAEVPFSDSDPYRSYYGEQEYEKTDITSYRLTEAVIKLMSGSICNDPRINLYGEINGSSWKGAIAGCTPLERSTAASGAASGNFNILCQSASPAILMDWSEILFIYAEGMEKNKISIPGTSASLYYQAVNASIDRWAVYGSWNTPATTVVQANKDVFFSSDIGSFELAGTPGSIYADKLDCILSQKWLSMFYCGWEAWINWRRNEFPILKIGHGTSPNDYELPTRLGYPSSIVASNSANVQKALERMGGSNDMHTPLVWSYKALNGGSKYEHTKEYTLSH